MEARDPARQGRLRCVRPLEDRDGQAARNTGTGESVRSLALALPKWNLLHPSQICIEQLKKMGRRPTSETANAQTDETTRARLLDAAEKLFAEFGFEGTSVRAINAEADVNSGAIHYHFRTKEDLF